MRRMSTVLSGASVAGDMISADNDDAGDGAFESAPVDILPKEINLSGDTDEKLPNTFVVTVIQARNLQTAALRTTLSCYVKLSSLGREFKTSVVTKNDEPYWNETYSFRAIDWASSVTLSVRDKINVKMRFLGQVRISCTDLANLPGMATQSWFRLRDKNWERKPGMESEIELKVALVYTKKNDPAIIKDLAMTAGADMDEELVGIVADQDDETEEEALARRQEYERLEAERKNTMYANLKHGDYQIQVHVIEARDLKGENLSGTSDPYVQVEAMGLKKKTSTKYETLGCVFDEILFFHFKNMGRNELKHASITLFVYDKEKVLKDNLIGSYQLDCLSVYFRPHHELYRQWVAVHDHLNEKDRGVQGFLLVSITIIGPGDTFLVHDRDAEVAKEIAAASIAAASAEGKRGASFGAASLAALNPEGQSLVLLPPTIDLKLHFLVIKIVKAEDLPPMDQGGLITASGIDAFIQVGFGSTAACKTAVVTVKGVANLSPEFLEELWIPVMAPTLCRHIAISVWDRDLGRKDELVGVTSHDYQRVVSASAPGGLLAANNSLETAEKRRKREQELVADSGSTGPTAGSAVGEPIVELRWFNLYGPPRKRTNKKRAIWISQNPEFGSTYRGRVLLSMERVETPRADESDKSHTKRMQESSMGMLEPRIPKTLKYVLRCALFCGTDLPHAGASSILGLPSSSSGSTTTSSSTRVRVSVSIGSFELVFETQPVGNDGRVNWEECKEKWPIILPADLTQLPDIILTLSRQVDKDSYVGISYARIAASEFFHHEFTGKCQWIQLQEETSRRQTKYALDKTQSPGALLVKLGFGREEVAVRTSWGDDASLFASFRHHRVYREIRVHVFQFRKLLLREGHLKMPNPFVSVHCCGQVRKTATKYKTLDPLFYESLSFSVHVPHDAVYSPDLILYIHDGNVSSSSSTNIPGAILGFVRVPMDKAVRAMANASPARPSWYTVVPHAAAGSSMKCGLSGMAIEEPCGDALISVQYIDQQGPNQAVVSPDPRALVPEYEDATIEIVALGVRKLKARNLLGVRNPQVEFELTGGLFADGTTTRRTKPAVSTTGRNGKNVNLLERLVLTAKLPVDTLYAPQLSIRVIEVSLGGLRTTVLASSVVDLASKVPWSSDYVPSFQQQQLFENPIPSTTGSGGGGPGTSLSGSSSKRKSALDLLSSRWRRKSTQGVQVPQAGENDEDDDPFRDELFSDEEEIAMDGDDQAAAAAKKTEAAAIEVDDGIGVGQLPRMRQPVTMANASATLTDPAVRDELAREEQRRYMAAQADLLRGGRGGVYHPPPTAAASSGNSSTADPTATTTIAPYRQGRDWWINQGGEELEAYLKGKALETYPLFRSVLTRPSLLQRKRVRVQVKAGIFKGVISVREIRKKLSSNNNQSQMTSNYVDLERLKEPQALVVRIYVLKGSKLQAKDLNGFSDPYVKLKLGKQRISDRDNHKTKTLNPEFYKMYAFHTTLPGASQLEIEVWDHDLIKTDDFIGSTTIDLEDRWFHKEWQKLSSGANLSQDKGGELPIKPIEYRHLYTPKRSTSQGLIQIWVDILTAQQATLLPPVRIEPPTPKKFEVRVVVWRAENVCDKDASDVNDYFVKVWMEGGQAQNTDVHWRCANGKPCWNYRFKFPVEFPVRTPEFARLHIQLWDKDVIKWNDVIGEAQLDLYKWLRRCYETNRSVSPFLEIKALAKGGGVATGDQPSAVVNGEQEEGQGQAEDGDEEDEEEEDDEEDDEDEEEVVSRGTGTKENHALLRRNQNATKKKSRLQLKGKVNVKKPQFMDKQAQDKAKDGKKRTKEARESNEARLALNGLLDFIGMGNLPDDADWITIYYTDRESATSMDMGRIGISVQIVPEKEALQNAVGKGQESPNVNPYLPPPVGRMRLTANPIMMLKELVGPAMCLRVTLCCCCFTCVFFFATFGATIMSTLTFFETMSRNSQSNYGGGVPYQLPNYYPYATNGTTPANQPVVATQQPSSTPMGTTQATLAAKPVGSSAVSESGSGSDS